MIRKLLHFLTSRLVVTALLIAAQAVLLFMIILKMSNYFIYFYAFCILLSLFLLVYLVNNDGSPSLKIPWIILMLILPILGGIAYVCFGRTPVRKEEKARMDELVQRGLKAAAKLDDAGECLQQEAPQFAGQSHYIEWANQRKPYTNTECVYLPLGEVMFERLCEELKKARHFIFMEYFIVEEGTMWNTILEILQEKVKAGVEVRMMYDDLGCIMTLPDHYDQKLEAMGIKTVVFNRFTAHLTVSHNNRDHRKITVIDGNVGFNGGINLADEYINAYAKHGHWKDSAVMLKGEGVVNLTMMFLEAWNFYRDEDPDFSCYLPESKIRPGCGYVQSYTDIPLDHEMTGETVYMNILNQAQDYVWMTSPYLIIDHELLTALMMAAKRGVDVRLITPHIPDKWYVHLITQSTYPSLVQAGVKIYEYTPGFIHAKTFVSDDQVGVVGTINLDYRSLVHHYECATWMLRTQAVSQLHDDFLDTQAVSQPITLADCRQFQPLLKRWIVNVIKLFAPLM